MQTPNKLYTQDFNRDFSPKIEGAEILLSFNSQTGSAISWEVGKYTIKYNLLSSPVISSNKEKVDTKSLVEERSFEVAQEMLDKMKADFEEYRNQKE